ncbi:hypothetical protein F5Y17DRAFT_456417 [Xylariaceae sp. FL0594]|nr:hypothetical protein F5Y17DRAFT_456417 [Xylariaceae sp. FL0594]
MCYTIHYTSRDCGHHWLAIQQPCWPGYGFNHCPTFGDGVAREPSPEYEVPGRCPACSSSSSSTRGHGYGYGCGYDANLVRMIVDVRDRCRLGVGPSRGDPGFECAVM